jgi:hypothetical protein
MEFSYIYIYTLSLNETRASLYRMMNLLLQGNAMESQSRQCFLPLQSAASSPQPFPFHHCVVAMETNITTTDPGLVDITPSQRVRLYSSRTEPVTPSKSVRFHSSSSVTLAGTKGDAIFSRRQASSSSTAIQSGYPCVAASLLCQGKSATTIQHCEVCRLCLAHTNWHRAWKGRRITSY